MATKPISIEGFSLRNPSYFKIERYNLTKAGRIASGKMTMDLVAKKRKFILRYDTINSADKAALLAVIDGTNMFMNFVYYEDSTQKSAIVYVGDIPSERARDSQSTTYYKDFEFHLIEQ